MRSCCVPIFIILAQKLWPVSMEQKSVKWGERKKERKKERNQQTKGQHVFWNLKINYKKTIRPIEMKLAGIVVLIGPLRFQFKRWGSLKRGRQGRPRKVKFSQICPLKIQYRSKTYATNMETPFFAIKNLLRKIYWANQDETYIKWKYSIMRF